MQIYVRLIGEGTEVWKPVAAEPLAAEVFKLDARHDDRDIEVLQFLPGQIVRCVDRSFADKGKALAAVEQVERPGIKQPFLTCYDYGQGGVWVIVHAESGELIRTKYPELLVAPRVPDWMTPEVMSRLGSRQSYDLDTEPSGWLATLVEGRVRS